MDITGMAELALSGWKGQIGQDLGMRMLRNAAQQDASVVQLVASSTASLRASQASAGPGNGLGHVVDISA